MPRDGEIRKVGSILYYWNENKQQWVAKSDAPVPTVAEPEPEKELVLPPNVWDEKKGRWVAPSAPQQYPEPVNPQSARPKPTPFGRYLRDPWKRNPVEEYRTGRGGAFSAGETGGIAVTVSSGAIVKGRRAAERAAGIAQGFREQGLPVPEQLQTEEERLQQETGRREALHEQERGWTEQERQRQKQEFRTNVESAMELVDTAQVAPDSPAWAVQNDMKQAYNELQQFQKYAAQGADAARLKPKIAGLRERIASGAMRLQTIRGELQGQEDIEKGVEIDPVTGKRTTTVEREHKQALDFRKENQVAKLKEQQLDNRRALYQFKMDRSQQQVQFRTKQVENLLKKQVDAQTALADAKDEASRAEKTIPTATAKKGETPEQVKARAATEHAVSVQEANSAQLSAEQSLANINKLIGDAQRAAGEAEQRLMTAMNDMEREINRQVGIEQQPVAPGAGEQPKTVETMSDDELAAHLRANIGDAAAMAEAKRRRGR